jgi:hypothetical protein
MAAALNLQGKADHHDRVLLDETTSTITPTKA